MYKESVYPDGEKVIIQLANIVKKELSKESTGHDWWHIQRVWKMAKQIAQEEDVTVNMFVVETSALLHDIADWKFHKGDQTAGPQKARQILHTFHVDEETTAHISEIIRDISFKGAHVSSSMKTMEGKIVQDADRLDAIGAIGIARVFAYSGSVGRPIHDPTMKPQLHDSFEAYQTHQTTAINHFYEKLLLLQDRLHTQTAKKIAQSRHAFMEDFLKRFYAEWEGKV